MSDALDLPRGQSLLPSRWQAPFRLSPSRFFFGAAKLCLFVLFVWLKATSLWGHAPVYTGDHRVWATLGAEPWTSAEFWFPRRPLVLPLLFRLAGFYDPTVLLVQGVLATLSWGALALALSRLAERGVGSILCFALTLSIALTTPVHVWDVVIRAESTATSLVALSIALALGLVMRARVRPRFGWVLCALGAFAALLAAFSRDASAYLVILLGAWAVCAAFALYRGTWPARLRRSGFRVVLAFSLLLGGIGALAQANCRASLRYEFPLINVIFQRVLTDPEKLSYFARELGMPVTRPLLWMRGYFASGKRRFAFTAPALEGFRTWLRTQGYSGYRRYLFTHFEATTREALASLPLVAGAQSLKLERGSPTPLTAQLDAWWVTGPLSSRLFEATAFASLVGAVALFAKRRRTRLLGSLTLFFALASLSQLYICYHADAMEVQRHAVLVGTLLRLAFVTCLSVVVAVGGAAYRRVLAVRQREA